MNRPDRLRYVITGCAGSGTGWAHKMMNELGSRCGHENFYGFHTPPFPEDAEGESAWEAIGRLPSDLPVLLLVRNPLHVARSELSLKYFARERGQKHNRWKNDRYIIRKRPDIYQARDRLGRVLRYVATWDAKAMKRSNVRAVRLEDIDPEKTQGIFTYLTGRDVDLDRCSTALAEVGTSFNAHGGAESSLTWEQIEQHPDGGPVVDKARRWEYL